MANLQTHSISNQGKIMGSLTIRNIEDDVKQRLRVRAAGNGRSMEEEARDILRRLLGQDPPAPNLATSIRGRMKPSARADIAIAVREPMREPVILK